MLNFPKNLLALLTIAQIFNKTLIYNYINRLFQNKLILYFFFAIYFRMLSCGLILFIRNFLSLLWSLKNWGIRKIFSNFRIEKFWILPDFGFKFIPNTITAYHDMFVTWLLFKLGLHMVVVEPILTFIALNTKFIHLFNGMRFLAITITIKKGLIITIALIIILFFIVELASKRHSTISAITSEINLMIEFNHIMSFMTMQHASQTKSMSFNIFFHFTIILSLLDFFLLFLR